VSEVARLRNPEAKVTVVKGIGGAPAYLRVAAVRAGLVEQLPVGVCERGVDATAVEEFVALVHSAYAAGDPRLVSELVYGGPRVGDELVAAASRRGVRLLSFVEYQGLLDLRGYMARQTARLAADPLYPPGLYVPQRLAWLDQPDSPPVDDALGEVTRWLSLDGPRFVLLLADFGHGKTFLLHELARRLPEQMPHLVPVLVEGRTLEKAHTVDELVAAHFMGAGEDSYDRVKFGYLRRAGRVVLLFDGFDELVLRVSYERAADHLHTLLAAVDGDTKIVAVSRRQHFIDDNQARTVLGTRVEVVAASRMARLEDFTDAQIMIFLVNVFDQQLTPEIGDTALRRATAERAARDRLNLIHNVRDLLGLSRNPRMLAFIAELPAEDLRAARDRTGQISSADLYRLLVDKWLTFEVARRSPHPGAFQSLDGQQLRLAVDALALAMWEAGDDTTDVSGLKTTVRHALTDTGELKRDTAQAAHALGSGSLLVRDGDRFSFVHHSVLEYLVAVIAARQIEIGAATYGPLNHRPISDLMVDFLWGSASGEELAAWVQGMLGDSNSPPTARDNAIRIARRLGLEIQGARLAGQDLRGRDLSGQNLRFADLSGADLAGACLHHTDLTGADLRNANLQGAQLFGAKLIAVRVDGSNWERAVLRQVIVDREIAVVLRRAGAEIGQLPSVPLAENSSVTVAYSLRDAVAVTREAFGAAGRGINPTDEPELLEPGPVWVSAEVSPTANEVRRFGERLALGRVGYFIHTGELRRDAEVELDRMRVGGRPVVTLPVRALRAALADGRVDKFLKEVEQGYGTKDNLFDSKNALVDERFLFGRDVLLNTIGSAVRRGEHILVTGLRKVGKTSLLNVFRQHVVDIPVCMVDLQRYDRRTEDWPLALFEVILQAFDRWGCAEQDDWHFQAGAPLTATEFGGELEARAAARGRLPGGPQVLVVLDELERVFPAPTEVEAIHCWVRAMGALRAFSQGEDRLIGVIGADLRPVANRENMLGDVGTNPFFNLFQEVPLPLLDYAALVDMVEALARAMGVDDVEPDFTRRLFELTGGHPSLTRTIAGESYRRRRHQGKLLSVDLTTGVEHLEARNAIGFFLRNNLWQLMTPSERSLISDLVRTRRGARANRLKWRRKSDEETFVSLENQGLIDVGKIRIGLLRRWVRENGGSTA
jgi:hypothetical protein